MISKSTFDQEHQARKQESLSNKKKGRKSISYNTEGEPKKGSKRKIDNLEKEANDKKKELEALKNELKSQKSKIKEGNYLKNDSKKNIENIKNNNLYETKAVIAQQKKGNKERDKKGSSRGITYVDQNRRQEDILGKIEKSFYHTEELQNNVGSSKNNKRKKSKVYDENILKQKPGNIGTKVNSNMESTSQGSNYKSDNNLVDEEDKKALQKEPIVNHHGKEDQAAFKRKIPDSTYSKQIIPYDHELQEFILNSYDKSLFNNVSKKILENVLNSIKVVDTMIGFEDGDNTTSCLKWSSWICITIVTVALLVMAFTIGLVYLYILSGFLMFVFVAWCIISGYKRGKTVVNKKERAKKIEVLLKAANKKQFEPKGTWMSIGEDCHWLEFIILRPSKELIRQKESDKNQEKRKLSQRNLMNTIGGQRGLDNYIKGMEKDIEDDLEKIDPDSSMAHLNQSIHETKNKKVDNRRQSKQLKSAQENLNAEKKSVRFMDINESLLLESNISNQDRRKKKMSKKKLDDLEERENLTLDELRKAKRGLKDLKEARRARKEDLQKNGEEELELRSALRPKRTFNYDNNISIESPEIGKGWSKSRLKQMGISTPISEESDTDSKSNDSLDRSKFKKKKIGDENLSSSSSSEKKKKVKSQKKKPIKIDNKMTGDINFKMDIAEPENEFTENPYKNIILESQINHNVTLDSPRDTLNVDKKKSLKSSLILDQPRRNSYKKITTDKKSQAVGKFLDAFDNDHSMPDKRISNKETPNTSKRSIDFSSRRNISNRLIEHPSIKAINNPVMPSDKQISRIQKSNRRNSIFVGSGIPQIIKESNNDDSPGKEQSEDIKEDYKNKKSVYYKNNKAKTSQRKIENESKQRSKEDFENSSKESDDSDKKQTKNTKFNEQSKLEKFNESDAQFQNFGNINLSVLD